ncbi:MAG TPA: prolyl oligopeptidase family serine peptidase [Thermoanaerobaculia bacterium]|nr:prolyl oligopeptidase family serine peptidase [Thermoanaerobaculia bacterium]
MRRNAIALLLLVLAACTTTTTTTTTTPPAQPPKIALPVTQATPVTETIQGVEITDPYRWLEEQESPATREWINRENAYTDAMLAQLPDKARFVQRIESLLNTDQMSFPIVRGGRYFFTKRPAGQDLFSIYMRESATGPDILLIDPAPMSPKHTTNVGINAVSDNGKTMSYFVRQGGADEVEVRFYDLDGRHDIGVPLSVARYFGVSLTPDGRTAYFTRYTSKEQHVFQRPVGGGDEHALFGEGYGPDKIVGSGISDDGRYLLIQVSYGSAAKKTELYIKELTTEGPIRTVVNDLEARSGMDAAGDKLIIQTNWDAPNERIMIADVANPERANWKELVPENKNAALQSVALAGGRIYANYLENVKPRVIGYTIEGRQQEEIKFDTIGNVSNIIGQWTSPIAFYRFASFAVPPTTYAYDVASRTSTQFFRQSAPVNSADFNVEQVWYTSKDGTRIPMFLMYQKGLQRNGSNPTLLTGYGGFVLSSLPGFSATAVTWAESGGVYALANLRGGGEFGEAWHKAGMLENKQNVFDDFAGAAQYLIDQHYTSPQHLGISGGSNGGLLVTALLTQRPDLVKAVVCSYPLIDMIRYHRFLVARFWVPEYGSSEDPQQFKWIYAYSPYQHVVKGKNYPAVLFISGDSDTRVAPLHARKMTAMMQASSGSRNPVLLRYHVSSGHSGGEPLKEQVNNQAEWLSFLKWQLR